MKVVKVIRLIQVFAVLIILLDRFAVFKRVYLMIISRKVDSRIFYYYLYTLRLWG